MFFLHALNFRACYNLDNDVLLISRIDLRIIFTGDELKLPGNIACDLQDFESVRKAAAEIKSQYSKIYCLANNAGIMATPDRATKVAGLQSKLL